MAWNLEEALDYYQKQGAPSDQSVLISLFREIQEENGSITNAAIAAAAQAYQVKETFLLALLKRIPSLRLEHTHSLELCCGETCRKGARLASFAEKACKNTKEKIEITHVGCMRQCGKGPNLRWDGVLYQQADEALLRGLIKKLQ